AFPSSGDRKTLSGGEKITIIEQNDGGASSNAHVAKVSIEQVDSTVSAVGRTDSGQYQAIVPEQPDLAVRNEKLLRQT
ncbi:hypothetical protein G6O45_27280, partial [Salmonella enterica subsp. enterica serovar Istanbul]|nr:hypothetical protein [Salmonella enterica subsp. enterica serovar Istanbul]